MYKPREPHVTRAQQVLQGVADRGHKYKLKHNLLIISTLFHETRNANFWAYVGSFTSFRARFPFSWADLSIYLIHPSCPLWQASY